MQIYSQAKKYKKKCVNFVNAVCFHFTKGFFGGTKKNLLALYLNGTYCICCVFLPAERSRDRLSGKKEILNITLQTLMMLAIPYSPLCHLLNLPDCRNDESLYLEWGGEGCLKPV